MEELRKSKNWTSKQISKKIGIDYRTIRRYETNIQKPPSNIIEDYSRIFNVSLDFLFYGTEISDLELISAFKHLSPKQKRAVMAVIESYQ